MSEVLLSITIPTYNRRAKLQETLEIIVPQLTDEVELLVCDKCSPDDTGGYLEGLESQGKLRRWRHRTNIGADRNMVGCIERAVGRYVWLLCDDDKPCSNAVEEIVSAIKRYEFPPMLYLRVKGSDPDVSTYDPSPVATDWTGHDRNSFLAAIGHMFTFAPSNIVRRDAVDLDFVKSNYDTNLVPASLCLSTAGRGNCIYLSNSPLLYARGGNNGGYDACSVFTRNILALLARCRDELGFDKDVLARVYDENLGTVVVYIVQVFPISHREVMTLFRYGYRYGSFYSNVAPALIRRALARPELSWLRRKELALPRRVVGRVMDIVLSGVRSLIRRAPTTG
jgi:glycosyltransferase involved in cell wall biosynthesis